MTGKGRATNPRRMAEALIAGTNSFTSDFEINKKLVSEMTSLPKFVRNRVAGHVTRIKKSESLKSTRITALDALRTYNHYRRKRRGRYR